jgi:hypothetical protein
MVKIKIIQGGLEMFTTVALIRFIPNVSWKYANCIFLKISIFSMQRESTPVTHRALRFQDNYCFHLRYKIFFAKKIPCNLVPRACPPDFLIWPPPSIRG